MKFKCIVKIMFFTLMISTIASCKEKNPQKEIIDIQKPLVVNGDDDVAIRQLQNRNLDSVYMNLLNPKNVSDSEYNAVSDSWIEFHKQVSQFIDKENFKWEVPDSTITIMNRIYFDKNGTIDYYAFKVMNPSVSLNKRAEYEKILQKFSRDVKINLQREENYAQCGNIIYLNY